LGEKPEGKETGRIKTIITLEKELKSRPQRLLPRLRLGDQENRQERGGGRKGGVGRESQAEERLQSPLRHLLLQLQKTGSENQGKKKIEGESCRKWGKGGNAFSYYKGLIRKNSRTWEAKKKG